MKTSVLVIVKPDGMQKNLAGNVLEAFGQTDLELIGVRLIETSRETVQKHYQSIKDKPFFEKQVSFFLGNTTEERRLLFFVYHGEDAVKKARTLAGATNPEEADRKSLRGRFGRITTKDIFENVVHVSSEETEAEREIKLWFSPEDLVKEIFPIKKIPCKGYERRGWA